MPFGGNFSGSFVLPFEIGSMCFLPLSEIVRPGERIHARSRANDNLYGSGSRRRHHFFGNGKGFSDLETAMKELKHEEWGELSTHQSITFCGIPITLSVERTVEMSQEPYYKKIQQLIKSEFLEKEI